jgi:hypothetical protein
MQACNSVRQRDFMHGHVRNLPCESIQGRKHTVPVRLCL